ncbi:MAG: hypothetical protein EOO77_45135 [Oxalobacteraceae bacterium]|nr:MAG: hypothetical protein EOO77_45135 [Oxalobacteraceae bacterium]
MASTALPENNTSLTYTQPSSQPHLTHTPLPKPGPNDPKGWPKGYECVQGDDGSENSPTGIWRYNRENDLGRVCGSKWTDPNNLIPYPV